MSIITATLTFTFAVTLNMQECHCDGVCGTGSAGEQGPFQIRSFIQMEKLGCGPETDWWEWDESWR